MTFILQSSSGDELQINAWKWVPTTLLLFHQGLIDDEQQRRMGANGSGGQVSEELAHRIVSLLDTQLVHMKPGDRLRSDFRITSAPKSGSLAAPVEDLYSATYEWLVQFRDFCRHSRGFSIV
jgi:hypothetical protein